jgi:hypothetical protein
MASSCVFVRYLVVRRINPRLFPLDVANVSFVLRRHTLVSSPDSGFAARIAAMPPEQAKSPAQGRAFQKNQMFAWA